MKRFRAPVSALYVLSVIFVALGHCWPASPANAAPAPAASVSHEHDEAVAHGSHGQPDGISAEGCLGDETACAIAISSPALLPAPTSLPDPLSKIVVLTSAATPAFAAPAGAFTPRGPPDRRTHSLHSYAEAFARTGRLLI
ncbi:hypothetical protein Plav_0345 [Parvibaculum lavamentivorans DS-1]|uniref:Lipoprotein n=1 Tax=Parvibaculum lavamentivorans (strain DS-1 / DSM 13023 / NCIMB 13966) TaxID=402881 RepID=A7HPY5_PARL1|nr:hypothetical protein [Parvibaculum lavamentivorans]ABS61968.1 hypothetical protein Plav_0345 [Parvibaculum lavamentivorans DS-1]